MQYLLKAEREELSALSKTLFGTKGEWQKILEKGLKTPMTNYAGGYEYRQRYFTVEQLKSFMLENISAIEKKRAEEKEKREIEMQKQTELDLQTESGGKVAENEK